MYLRKTKKKRTEVSFEDSLSFDSEGNELHLEDVLGTKEDIVTKPIEDELDKYLMYKEVDKLGKRDKEIIELRYGLNGKKEMTQKEVANKIIEITFVISIILLLQIEIFCLFYLNLWILLLFCLIIFASFH